MKPLLPPLCLSLAANVALTALLVLDRLETGNRVEAVAPPEAELAESVERSLADGALPGAFGSMEPDSATLSALREENAKLREDLGHAQSELSVYNARRSRPMASDSPGSIPRDPLFRMLEDPGTAQIGLDWIRADQSSRYASLIALTGVKGAERDALLQLLTDRYATRADIGRFGSGALAKEQMLEIDREYQDKLTAIVGGPMSELFLKAEQKPLSFNRIREYDTMFRVEAEPLSEAQYLPVWNLLSSTILVGYPRGTPEEVEAIERKSIENNLGILPEVKAMLTPAQYALFERKMQEELALIKARAQMAKYQMELGR